MKIELTPNAREQIRSAADATLIKNALLFHGAEAAGEAAARGS